MYKTTIKNHNVVDTFWLSLLIGYKKYLNKKSEALGCFAFFVCGLFKAVP